MPHRSEIHTVLRSQLPADKLVASHDVDALLLSLAFKRGLTTYESVMSTVLARHETNLQAPILDHLALEPSKQLGAITVDSYQPLRGACRDEQTGFSVGYGSPTTYVALHMAEPDGKDDILAGLNHAAEYVAHNPTLASRDAVVGLTYLELGRFFARGTGFELTETETVNPGTLGWLQATHDAVLTINRRALHPVEPAIVHMATDEFIERFR